MSHPDFEELLNVLLPFAKQQLEKYGEFFPFGASITVEGELVAAMAQDSEEPPNAERALHLLIDGFRQSVAKAEARAVALCWDAMLTDSGERSDAIAVGLEMAGQDSLNLYLPYAKGPDGTLVYDELVASRRDPEVFVESPG